MSGTTDVLMVSSPPGESGIGDYAEDLSDGFTSINVSHLTVPIGSNSPSVFARVAIAAALAESDVIHIQHEYGQFGTLSLMSWVFFPVLYTIAMIRRVPVVITVHEGLNEELVTEPLELIKRRYIQLLNIVTIKGADHVIFLSEKTSNEIRKSISVPAYSELSHGVKNERFINLEKDDAKQYLGYEPETVLITEPGYIEPRKGSDKIVEIASKLPEYEFVLAGGITKSAHQEYLKGIESEAPQNLSITGQLSKEQFHTAFIASDLVLLPYQETNQGGVINSVNQSGIFNRCATYAAPTIASKQPYFEQLEESWCCVKTCDFKDMEATVNSIRELIENKQMRTDLADAIAEYADEHSFSKLGQHHEEVYSSLGKQHEEVAPSQIAINDV